MSGSDAQQARGDRAALAASSPPLLPGLRRNGLLAALPEADLRRLLPDLEPVALPRDLVLLEPGQPVNHAHFPTGAVLSLVIAMADGRAAEAATVGREGVVGAVAGGVERGAFSRVAVQVSGPALRIEARRLEAVKVASSVLRDLLGRYADALLAQVLQAAACNALHTVEQRLARWMLMTLDRVGGDTVPLTQEHLAEMLGTHRVTVADALRGLEAAGVVRRGRLQVHVTDRAGLEARACECLVAVREHFARLLPPAADAASTAATGQLGVGEVPRMPAGAG